MSEPRHPVLDLLEKDPRYKLEAYHFVRDALSYAQDVMEMGVEGLESEPDPEELAESDTSPWIKKVPADLADKLSEHVRAERHLSGQELCLAIRQYALEQYGMMAKVVLNSWGVQQTGDFGDIVYNLIDIGLMKKSKEDRREDFNDVYDFQQAFEEQYEITDAK